jgi:hypothetical protein
VSSHRHPSEILRGDPWRATVPTWRGTYRLCTGPCNLESLFYPLRSHQKCNHNRGQRRPTDSRSKRSPRPPATTASSGKALPTPSSSKEGTGPGGKAAAIRADERGFGTPVLFSPTGRLLGRTRVFRCPATCGCLRDSREGKHCPLPRVVGRGCQEARGWAEGR